MSSPSLQRSPSRGFWLKQLHQWHWISAALCLVAMLMFAITGFTLNHAAQIEAKPQTVRRQAQMPTTLLREVAGADAVKKKPLPTSVIDWVRGAIDVALVGRVADWSQDEIYISMPTPGVDAWLSIDRQTGQVEYEHTDRGWISYLNDLHKGRNAGPVWGWFIDVFALACVIFSVTGLLLLKMHAVRRASTWPLVAFGLLLPLLIILIFIH